MQVMGGQMASRLKDRAGVIDEEPGTMPCLSQGVNALARFFYSPLATLRPQDKAREHGCGLRNVGHRPASRGDGVVSSESHVRCSTVSENVVTLSTRQPVFASTPATLLPQLTAEQTPRLLLLPT